MIWILDIEPAIDERSVVHSLVFDPTEGQLLIPYTYRLRGTPQITRGGI